ncbi:Uma2 family endonuclease [Yinghuangia soli]|uniref:Uma2 family endonuclease n=1 Tax=Yinghuangia soli TaxID=2908204 RepID=A0AA41U3L1_9ACTN|nr:Uma2 family endonuclease [Yinghuangia soli]MCF2531931.1 Uma2 family endonuclease [Yinghuangia soli]
MSLAQVEVPQRTGISQPWTVEQVLRMPDDAEQRTELVGGSLLMSPSPGLPHQMASRRLANRLESAAAAAGFPIVVYEAVNVVFADSLLIPDIVLVDDLAASDEDGRAVPAEAVLLAVEIASPSNRANDVTVKPAIYAAAGIPWYWRLDMRPAPKLVISELEAGRYVERSVAPAGKDTSWEEPFPMTLNPLELLRLR